MAGSRPVLSNIQSDYYRYGLLTQLNSHVTSQMMKKGDVEDFQRILESYSRGLSSVIKRTHPVQVIRGMFPGVMLLSDIRNFLVHSYFIIRHPEGVYQYPHGNDSALRTRYELRLNFAGLFILSHYNLVFRTFSVENQNNIGRWERVLPFDIEGCQIEFIPKKSEDIFSELNNVARVALIADKLSIFPNNSIFQPQQPLLELGKLNLKLQQAISHAYPALQKGIEAFVSSPRPDLAEDAEMKSVDEQVMIPSYLQPFCHVQNDEVIVSIPSNADSESQYIMMQYYNFLRILHLLQVSKSKIEFLTHASQDYTYTPNAADKMPSNAETVNMLMRWMNGILAMTTQQEELVFVDTMKNSYSQYNFIDWRFESASVVIPVAMFNSMLAPVIRQFLEVELSSDKIGVLRQQLIHASKIRQSSSEDLLREVLSQPDYSDSVSVFVRKLAVHNAKGYVEAKKELMDMQDPARVKPATMMMSGLPIQTYKGQWSERSGLVLLMGNAGGVMMAGFKRPANSNLLKDPMIPLGFPFSVGGLRQIGGKYSISAEQFTRRLKIIHLRKTGQFIDKSRKDFLNDFFMRTDNAVLNEPLNFSVSEKIYVKYKTLLDDVDLPYTPHFSAYKVLLEQVGIELNRYLQGKNKNIYDYYLSLFNELLIVALDDPHKTLKSILADRRKSSSEKRMALFATKVHPSQLGLFASGRQYSTLSDEQVYSSNEVLLQGLVIKNRKQISASSDIFPSTLNPLLLAQQELVSRHGHAVAIFANTHRENGMKNSEGIVQAMQEWLVFEEVFGQRLPFAIYDEKRSTWEVLSQETFKERFLQNMRVTLDGVAPEFSFKTIISPDVDIEMVMTPRYLGFLIKCMVSAIRNTDASAKTFDPEIGKMMLQSVMKYLGIFSGHMLVSEERECRREAYEIYTLYNKTLKPSMLLITLDKYLGNFLNHFCINTPLQTPSTFAAVKTVLKQISVYQGVIYKSRIDDPSYESWKKRSIESVLTCILSVEGVLSLSSEELNMQMNVSLKATHKLFYADYVTMLAEEVQRSVASSASALSSASAVPLAAASSAVAQPVVPIRHVMSHAANLSSQAHYSLLSPLTVSSATQAASSSASTLQYSAASSVSVLSQTMPTKHEKKVERDDLYAQVVNAIQPQLQAQLTPADLNEPEFRFRMQLTLSPMGEKYFFLTLKKQSRDPYPNLEYLMNDFIKSGTLSFEKSTTMRAFSTQMKKHIAEAVRFKAGSISNKEKFSVAVILERYPTQAQLLPLSRPLSSATGFAALPPTGLPAANMFSPAPPVPFLSRYGAPLFSSPVMQSLPSCRLPSAATGMTSLGSPTFMGAAGAASPSLYSPMSFYPAASASPTAYAASSSTSPVAAAGYTAHSLSSPRGMGAGFPSSFFANNPALTAPAAAAASLSVAVQGQKRHSEKEDPTQTGAQHPVEKKRKPS